MRKSMQYFFLELLNDICFANILLLLLLLLIIYYSTDCTLIFFCYFYFVSYEQ